MCSKSELQIILTEIAKTAKDTFGTHLDSELFLCAQKVNCKSF